MGLIGSRFTVDTACGTLELPLLYEMEEEVGLPTWFDELTWYINLGIVSPVFKPPYTQAIDRVFNEDKEIWSD